MAHSPTLSTTVFITYEARNRDFEVEVEVEFTSDGEDIVVTKWTALGGNEWDINTDWFDERVYDAACDVADEIYAEWLAERGEYERDERMYREAA